VSWPLPNPTTDVIKNAQFAGLACVASLQGHPITKCAKASSRLTDAQSFAFAKEQAAVVG
jgi:hypothetical protein